MTHTQISQEFPEVYELYHSFAGCVNMADCQMALVKCDDDFEMAANWVIKNQKKAELK